MNLVLGVRMERSWFIF